MEPWYKICTPRQEVREGRSFNPDEFAIALEQVVFAPERAPKDYSDPVQFFRRTCFTRALREHTGMVLRRLSGKTENTPPVLTLITQFGGGKTHTLTTLYHAARSGQSLQSNAETSDVFSRNELPIIEGAKVAVFVGNAWDPQPGRETPWIDMARQLAGDAGVAALGAAAKTTAPGSATLQSVFALAKGPVLILMDEVLNFFNRHRGLADQTFSFLDNLYRAMTGMTHAAVVISLPRSQVEMTAFDIEWQEKISKVTRRVARDLIVLDEAEASEVIRRRLFEDMGKDSVRKKVTQEYAKWCYEHRAQLPQEWTSKPKAKEYLEELFLSCYPFHPATLSVFQRKWQTLQQFQQTRGTLAMFAQWISWVYGKAHREAHKEPLITIGCAPLEVPEFLATVLGQLGDPRIGHAIQTDIAGANAHAQVLDADTKGALREIHKRVGTAILFESSGGQVDKVARLPELRFALGGPEIDTATVDNVAIALEGKSFFLSRAGSDGFKVHSKAKIEKAVNDRRASLDPEKEVKPHVRTLVTNEFKRGATVPLVYFPDDDAAIPNNAKLTLVLAAPEVPWTGDANQRKQVLEWTKNRGNSARLSSSALVWCFPRSGRELRDKTESALAWKRVKREVEDGTLGTDYEKADRVEIDARTRLADDEAKEEVGASYRYVVILDAREKDGLRVLDLGMGHASTGQTLCGRVVQTLKTEQLLNEGFGATWLEGKWPPAFKASGAWPLESLRSSFLNGSLTRLLDPDAIVPAKIAELVSKGELGLAVGPRPDGTYDRVLFGASLTAQDITFDETMFVLTRAKAKELQTREAEPPPEPESPKPEEDRPPSDEGPIPPSTDERAKRVIRVSGMIPFEVWNMLGRKLLPKLRSGENVTVGVDFTTSVDSDVAKSFTAELRQVVDELGLKGKLKIE